MLQVKLKTHFSLSFSYSNSVPRGLCRNSQCPEASDTGNLKREGNLFILVKDGIPWTAKPMKHFFLWICVLSPLTTASLYIFPQHLRLPQGTGWYKQQLIWSHRGAGQLAQAVRPPRCCILNSERLELWSDDVIARYHICNHSDLCKLVEIVWKRRQTRQLSEERHFLKLPSTAPSRADRTEALEASRWCLVSTYVSFLQRAIAASGKLRLEQSGNHPTLLQGSTKRCNRDQIDNSKGTRLEGCVTAGKQQNQLEEHHSP